jgi:hypothetical protein
VLLRYHGFAIQESSCKFCQRLVIEINGYVGGIPNERIFTYRQDPSRTAENSKFLVRRGWGRQVPSNTILAHETRPGVQRFLELAKEKVRGEIRLQLLKNQQLWDFTLNEVFRQCLYCSKFSSMMILMNIHQLSKVWLSSNKTTRSTHDYELSK